MRKLGVCVISSVFILCAIWTAKIYPYKIEEPFRHSDVVAFAQGRHEDYKAYGVTFVAWGGYPRENAKSINRYRRNIREALSVGVKIGAKIGIVTEYKGFIDFAPDFMESRCIKVDDTPIIVGHKQKYKGHPPYWFCTNSPRFQEYLKGNIKRAMLCGPFGIMVDDPIATAAAFWHGGCYCKYCVAEFREYLKTYFKLDELQRKGIADIDSFNLRKYHKQFSHLIPEKRPLAREFLAFQTEKAADIFREIMEYAIQIRGHRIPVGCNLNPISRSTGYFVRGLDYFSCELNMAASTGSLDNSDSLFAFKMADALHRPAAIMGYGMDHAFIKEKNLPGIIRCWVAEAYAFGNYFMAPYCLWAYTPEKGEHYYRPRHKSELAPIYQLVKRHSYLFDAYEVVARVAVVHSYEAFRKGSDTTKELVKQLAALNVPFELVISGDDVLKIHLSSDKLAKYDAVIVPVDAVLAPVDAEVLRRFKAYGGLLIDSIEKLDLSSQIQIVGTKKIRATLRAVHGDLNRPIVVHLLNRDYDVETDSCHIKTDFTVRIPKKLLDGRQIQKARYVRPNSWEPKKKGYFLRSQKKMPDLDLTFETSDDYIEVKVPELDVWGIVILS